MMDNRKIIPYIIIVIVFFLFIIAGYFALNKKNIIKEETYDVGKVEIQRLENGLQYVKFRGHEYLVNSRSTPLHLPDCKSKQHEQ